MFELTIIEEFEAAHRLPEYDGKCCRLHGHNWKVEVAVQGTELDSSGMLIDFKLLKAHVAEVMLTLDHYYLNETEAFKTVPPTAEYIAKYICEALSRHSVFTDRIRIHAVRVWESPRSCASYIPEA